MAGPGTGTVTGSPHRLSVTSLVSLPAVSVSLTGSTWLPAVEEDAGVRQLRLGGGLPGSSCAIRFSTAGV